MSVAEAVSKGEVKLISAERRRGWGRRGRSQASVAARRRVLDRFLTETAAGRRSAVVRERRAGVGRRGMDVGVDILGGW